MSEGTTRRRWVVTGAHEKTGEVQAMTIESVSAARAEATARKHGLLVSAVVPDALDYESPPDEESGTHLESVSPGTAFRFGFYGGLGAMAAWVVVSLAVGAVLSLFGLSVHVLARLFGF